MVCSICGSDEHIKSNKKFHPTNKLTIKKKPQLTINPIPYKPLEQLSKNEIIEHLFGGAKKGLLADLLKGIDLRIKSY